MCRAGARLEGFLCPLVVVLGQPRLPTQPTLTPLMMCWGGMRTTIRSVSSSFWVPALTASMGDTSGDREGGSAGWESQATGPDHTQPEPNLAAAARGPGGTTGPRAESQRSGSSFPPGTSLSQPFPIHQQLSHPYLRPPGWG